MLLGNYHVIHKSPGKFRAGIGAICGNSFIKNGSRRGIYTEASIPDQWGLPVGYYNGWMLPRKAGYIAGVNAVLGDSTITGGAVMGINIDGLAEGLSDANATLALIVSMSGLAGGICFVSASVAGVIYGSGSAGGTSSGIALLGALAGIIGSANGLGSGSVNVRADGYMTGTVSPFTELSPQGLAQAVWSALASENNITGSMGQKLNSAASGGVDLNALAEAVWEYATRTLTGGTGALTPEQATQLANTVKKGDTLLNLGDIILPL